MRSTKPRRPRRTLEQKTAQQLVSVADKAYSRYIRIRDSEFNGIEWLGSCITCDRRLVVVDFEGKWNPAAQCGHFIGRAIMKLRFDEENTSLQCAHCNAWLDKDSMLERYRAAVDLKYGKGTYLRLKRDSKAPDAYKRPSKEALLQIISDSKSQVEYYLASNS